MSADGFATPGLPASAMKGAANKVEPAAPLEEPQKPKITGHFADPNLPTPDPESGAAEEEKALEGEEESSLPRPPLKYPPLNYETPEWSCAPREERYFEVLKNGRIVSKSAPISKAFLLAGRLPICDFELEHASISRYHAVIQFKQDGSAYLYDLGSTHGTFLNKAQIPKRTYQQLRIGDMIRFGASTRMYILQGAQDEEELARLEAAQSIAAKKVAASAQSAEPTEISWGFSEDATEEETPDDIDMPETDGPVDENAYYHADPRKALRIWLENRGAQMTFQVEEDGPGHDRTYTAKIELPVETGYGMAMTGVGTGGRKRAAEVDAALDACIKLDKRGLLRSNRTEQALKERKRKKELFGDDDNADDSFYDRTSHAPKAKPKGSSKAETHTSLIEKRDAVLAQIQEINRQIQQKDVEAAQHANEDDEMDEFMTELRQKEANQAKLALRRGLPPLEKEAARLEKLIKMVAPSAAAILLPIPPTPTTPAPVEEKPLAHPTATRSMPARMETNPPAKKAPTPEHRVAEPVQEPTDSTDTASSADTTSQATTDAKPGPPAKKRRVYGMLTQSQVEEHMQVEAEEAVDFIPPDIKGGSTDAKSLNANYGY
ncbi:Kanadaptin [Geranomyces variabilis]|uniref:Kanadaptin n=1 Tax=Geranomyces variabilis TaxID=109894 RepID=A0AAD5TQF5_9FUNG|nr:Kanadaptin [Geranomyces variabilis]